MQACKHEDGRSNGEGQRNLADQEHGVQVMTRRRVVGTIENDLFDFVSTVEQDTEELLVKLTQYVLGTAVR